MLLGSHVPTAAQTTAPQISPALDRLAPTMTMVRTAPTSLLAPSLLLPEDPGKSVTHFSYVFAGTYERDQGLEGLESLSPMREVKTVSHAVASAARASLGWTFAA